MIHVHPCRARHRRIRSVSRLHDGGIMLHSRNPRAKKPGSVLNATGLPEFHLPVQLTLPLSLPGFA